MTSPDGANIEFLLVTDDPRLREEFRFALPTGAAARYAADARVAWKELQAGVPTLVVVDIQSGSAGGFGLARDMNARSDLAEIPVVMLLERVQDAWLAKQAGAVSWILKPIAATALARQCLELLARL
jgi:DNA-binding response OmpR family regulator